MERGKERGDDTILSACTRKVAVLVSHLKSAPLSLSLSLTSPVDIISSEESDCVQVIQTTCHLIHVTYFVWMQVICASSFAEARVSSQSEEERVNVARTVNLSKVSDDREHGHTSRRGEEASKRGDDFTVRCDVQRGTLSLSLLTAPSCSSLFLSLSSLPLLKGNHCTLLRSGFLQVHRCTIFHLFSPLVD